MSSGDTQAEGWNCTSYPALVANPDIGGIGTILAFGISVYLTLTCCVAKARIDHIRTPNKDTPRLDLWSFALGNLILNFSYQQVVLGIAVLIAGISQLSSGLDSYHWQTVLNLAWFSSFTHILTLTALRAENRSNNKIKVIRVVAMGVLAVILMCMVYTAGWVSGKVIDASPEDSKSSPPMSFSAWCLFRPKIPWMWQNHLLDIQYNWTYVVLAFIILVFSYYTRTLLLYFESIGQVMTMTAKFLWLDRLASRLGIMNMRSIGSGQMEWEDESGVIDFYGLYMQYLLPLGWLSFALVWGTVRIFTIRELPNSQDNLDSSESMSAILSEENDWGFGQVLGLSLMILPLLKAYSSPPDATSLRKKSSTDTHTSPDTSSDYDILPSSIDLSQTYTSTSINLQKSQVRIEIENEVWFKKLIYIIYFLSVITGGITIVVGLLEPPSFLGLGSILVYVEWISVDLFVLWLVTLIFIDHDIQRYWMKSWMGKVTKKMSWFWWCLFVLFLVTFCFVAWVGSIFVLIKGLEIITH
ncbi:hypothetical protein EAF00_008341 [Botryotinia globosa]|nr:hypothetical protein EAF00_008341 [Botryotinia globosa]